MGYNIPSGFSRVTLRFGAESGAGSQIVTGFGIDSDPTEGVLDIFQEWWEDSLRVVTGLSYELGSLEARNNTQVLERAVGIAGQVSSPLLPPNCAALINLGSGLVGRKFRGRVYLPGVLPEGEVNVDGTITETWRNSLQGVVDYLGALVQAQSRTIRILHAGAEGPTLALSAEVNGRIATQRRRLRR